MKEKILISLKTKYPNLGLSEKSFEGVAEFLSKTVKEETEIENVVADAELFVKSIQAEADRVRFDSSNKLKELQSKAEKLEEQLKNSKPNTTPPDGDGAKGNDDIPAWAKALQEKIDTLESEKQKLGQLEVQKELRAKAKDIMIQKDIDKSLCDDILSDITLSETDTPETIADKGVNKYNYFKTKFSSEAGAPNGTQGQGNVPLDDFFEMKKQANEEDAKSLENVNIK